MSSSPSQRGRGERCAAALAWVYRRPGVASTIIGARRLDKLDQNLAALALALTADQVARLDKLSKPTLGFPMSS